MDLLLITAGTQQNKASPIASIDPPLSDTGMRQATATANWLSYSFLPKRFRGICGPQQTVLQTASLVSAVAEVSFSVNCNLRSFIRPKSGPIQIPNRSILYENLTWPLKEWDGTSLTFPEESVEDFVDRCSFVLYNLQNSGYNDHAIITHVVPAVVFSELAIGVKPEEVKRRLANFISEEKATPASELHALLSAVEKHIFSAHKDCGMTLITNGKPLWFSKIVYEA